MAKLPEEYIQDFDEKFIKNILGKIDLHFSDVDVKSRADYKKILQLDLSEKTLKQLQEKRFAIYQLNDKVANLFTADETDNKQIKSYKKSFNNQLDSIMKSMCAWWIYHFSDLSNGHALFANSKARVKDIERFKDNFYETTSLNIDVVHSLITMYTKFKEQKENKIKNLEINKKDQDNIILEQENELEYLYSATKSFDEMLSKELEISTLPETIKKILLPESKHKRNWDDPRSYLPFSIQSNMKQIFNWTYNNGVKEIVVGSESQILPFGDCIIAWDNKNYTTADSCRVNYSRNHVSIAISDGATQGGFNSALFAHVLTTFVSSYMPLSVNGMYFFNRKPLRDLYLSMLEQDEMHSKIRDMGHELAQTITSSAGKRNALATIAHVNIQESGFFQASRLGDCCIFKLTSENEIEHINVDPDLEKSETYLIGPSTRWSNNKTKVSRVEGEINFGEILFGCTDHLALFCKKFPEQAAELIRKITDNPSETSICGELFQQVAINLPGEDDLALFTYKHQVKSSHDEIVECTYDDEEKLIIDNIEYEHFQKQYYYNKELNKGVRRISRIIYENLRHLKNSVNEIPDFLVEYEIKLSREGANVLSYFAFMPHLNENEFTNMSASLNTLLIVKCMGCGEENHIVAESCKACGGEISESDNKHEHTEYFEKLSTELQNLYVKMEQSGVTHVDISPENIFINNQNGRLICVDPDAFFCEGCFVGDERGHRGMYGPEDSPGHVYFKKAHRLPLKILLFNLDLIKSGIRTSDSKSIWELFNNSDDELFISKEDISAMMFPNWPDNKPKIVEIRKQLSQKFNLDLEIINQWINKLDCEKIYTLDFK